MTLCEGVAHDVRHRVDVDRQWVDAHVFAVACFAEPPGQHFQIQYVAGVVAVVELAARDDLERMLVQFLLGARRDEDVFSLALADEAFLDHVVENDWQVQPAFIANFVVVRLLGGERCGHVIRPF